VNRQDGDDKEYGYIVDYKDLFKSLESSINDYTSGALDGYDKEDLAGLLEDLLGKAREHLGEALEAVNALCEPVEMPKDSLSCKRWFDGLLPHIRRTLLRHSSFVSAVCVDRARPTKITPGPRREGVRRDRQPAHAVLERQLTRKVALFECCPGCKDR